jgi:hypothetical protein
MGESDYHDEEDASVYDNLRHMNDPLEDCTFEEPFERCGAYAECWKELGKPSDWKGCSLPMGHEGYHTDLEG